MSNTARSVRTLSSFGSSRAILVAVPSVPSNDERAGEVVAGTVAAPAAEPEDLAVCKHDLQTEDMIGRNAVGKAVGTPGVLGNVPPNRAGSLT